MIDATERQQKGNSIDACCDEKGKNNHCATYWSETTPPSLEKDTFKGKNWEYQGILAQIKLMAKDYG